MRSNIVTFKCSNSTFSKMVIFQIVNYMFPDNLN